MFVFIGHDLFQRTAEVDRVVANAVLGDQAAASVRVLGYTRYADTSTSGEVSNVNGALADYSAAEGVSYELITATTTEAVTSGLDDADVLLVYEQERGGPLEEIGVGWRDALQDFVSRGGRVVVMEYAGSSWRIAVGAGLIETTGVSTISSTSTLTFAEPDSFIAEGLGPTYRASNGTGAMRVDDEEAIVVVPGTSAGTAVVLVRYF